MGLSLRPLKKIVGKESFLADVFSANTQADIGRRVAAGQPADYAQQQRQLGVAGRSIAVNPIQRAVVTARGVGESVIESPKYVTRGLGESLAFNTRDSQMARQATQNLQDQQAQIIASQGKILRDPTTTMLAKQRAQNLLQQMGQQSNETYRDVTNRTNQFMANTDPIRGAAATISTGFDLATLGVGSGAQAGLKTAAKEGARAFAKVAAKEGAKAAGTGAVSGALSPIVSRGKEATARDILTGAATGATIGGLLPVAQYGASKAIKGSAQAVEVANKKRIMSAADYKKWQYNVVGYNEAIAKGNTAAANYNAKQIDEINAKYAKGEDGFVSNPLAKEVGKIKATDRELTISTMLKNLDEYNARKTASDAATNAGMSAVRTAESRAKFGKQLAESVPTQKALPAPSQNFTMPARDNVRIAQGTETLASEYEKRLNKIRADKKLSPNGMQKAQDALDAEFAQRHSNLIDGVGEFAPQVPQRVPEVSAPQAGKPAVTPKQKPVVSSMAQGKAVSATPETKSIQELVMGRPQEANFGTSRMTNKGVLERGASAVTGGVQDLLQRGVKASLTSGNKALRTPGRLAVGISKQAAMNTDEAAQVAAAAGTKQVGQDVAETLYAQGAELGQAAKSNIGDHLDPELAARRGRTLKALTPDEQVEFDRLRSINDQIHEENYRLGLIDDKQYNANKDKYFGRDFTAAFDEKDLKQMGRSLGLDRTFYKHRKDLNDIADDVIAAASEDPYLITAKRIQNLEANRAYLQQSNWLADSGRAIDTPTPGYIQVPDAPKYGGLKGKYVLKEDLENLDGFIYDTKVAQAMNDLITLYDRNPVRRTRKMILTVLNPAVRLGNVTSNATFAWLNGINPATLAKNWSVGKKMITTKSPEYLEAAQQGIFGSSIIDKEFQRTANEIGVPRNRIAQWLENRKNSYGATDDHAKMAAYITHRQRGLTAEQASQQVRRGFQNYDMVGYMYDISAKTPIGGKAFGRFGSELTRIMSNAVADRPLRVAGTVAGVATLGTLLSRLSGETEENRKTREQRLGAARIPFTNVSLSFQTPAGEVNMARLLGITTYNDVNGGFANEASRLGPFDMPFSASIGGRDRGGQRQLLDVDAKPQALAGDPLIGPLIQLGMNKDFRGKEITSTAAPTGEKAKEALRYLQQSYVPYMNEADSLRAATNFEKQGRPDVSQLTPEQQASVSNYYDKVRTLPQAVARTLGVKVEQFGPEEAATSRQKQAEFELRKTEAEQNNLIKSEKETAKYLSDKGRPIVTAKGGGSTNPKVTQLSNGAFYAPSIKSGQKEFDTQQEADMAVAKDEFKKSDKKIQTVGDMVLYKTKDGTVKTEPKVRYDASKEIASLDLELDRSKRADNVNKWADAAQKKWDALEKKKALYDPETEADEITKLTNAQEDLQAQADKYAEYGGFEKPKKPKKNGGLGIGTASMGVSVTPTSRTGRPSVSARGGQLRSVAGRRASRPTVTVKKSRV
jgi:hypothetical protein